MKRNPSPQPRVPWRASPLPARHQLARTSLPQHLTAPTPFPCRSHPARRSAKNRSSRSRYQRGLGAMMLVGDNDVRQRQRRSIRVSREERAGVLFHDCMNVWQFTDLGGRGGAGKGVPVFSANGASDRSSLSSRPHSRSRPDLGFSWFPAACHKYRMNMYRGAQGGERKAQSEAHSPLHLRDPRLRTPPGPTGRRKTAPTVFLPRSNPNDKKRRPISPLPRSKPRPARYFTYKKHTSRKPPDERRGKRYHTRQAPLSLPLPSGAAAGPRRGPRISHPPQRDVTPTHSRGTALVPPRWP